jgi:hypothetical protein
MGDGFKFPLEFINRVWQTSDRARYARQVIADIFYYIID